jgi:hypothetical protein
MVHYPLISFDEFVNDLLKSGEVDADSVQSEEFEVFDNKISGDN